MQLYIKKIFLILFFCLINLFAQANELSKNDIKELEKINIFKKSKVKIKEGYDYGSIYHLNIVANEKNDEIYLTKDKNVILYGIAIDTNTGTKLEKPVDLLITIGKESYVYGEGKDEYVLFTDPECPYCKKFESYLPKIKDKVKIRVFLFPLEFHKNARDLSLYILSQKSNDDKISAAFEFKIGDNLDKIKNFKFDKEQIKQLDENIKIGNKFEINSTPKLFDSKGNNVIWINVLEKYGINVEN